MLVHSLLKIILMKFICLIAIKMVYGGRELRYVGLYSLKTIKGGHHLEYSSELWLNYKADQDSESTLSLDTYYSFDDGLLTDTDFEIYVPIFNNKVKKNKSNTY